MTDLTHLGRINSDTILTDAEKLELERQVHWALEHAPVRKPAEVLTLIALIFGERDITLISEIVGCPPRSVRRHLRTLTAAGLVTDMQLSALHTTRGAEPVIVKAGPVRKSIPAAVRRAVYERDLYRCVTCGTHLNLTLDHVIPHSANGPDTVDNLQTMCGPCNSRKGAR